LSNWKPAGKKPRIGFLSAYFCNHTIGRLNIGMVEQLDREQFDVSVIALRAHRDGMVDRFRKAADHYVEVPRSPAVAGRQIAELGLDVLLFADVGMDCVTQSLSYCRMAPVQAATWGHPVTTGSPEVDYFISTALAEHPEADTHYSERLLRLPSLGVYYHRPELEGAVRTRESFGLNPKGHIYLCPQTLFKFHPDFARALAGILQADPLGELVLIEARSPEWTSDLRSRFEKSMPEDCNRRIKFLAPMPPQDFLQLLRLGDVMLDPFPFGGGNSIYESLAVGTPVVTWPCEFLRGRLAAGLLRQVTEDPHPTFGLGALDRMLVDSLESYIQQAVEIACDSVVQNQLRQQLAFGARSLFMNQQTVFDFQQMLHGLCIGEPQ